MSFQPGAAEMVTEYGGLPPGDLHDQRILIDNRGEVAQRLVTVCRELGAGAVLACSDLDLDSLAAQTTRSFGASDDRFAVAPVRGTTPARSYEHIPTIVATAQAFRCTAVHPGYGHLSENAKAVRAFEGAGIGFVGPSAEIIELVGDKESARRIAQECDIPLLPGTGILATVQFPDEGTYDKADTVYQMYKQGFLSAWSIGFMPLDYEENEQGGYNFKSWELFEFSSVPVPDNPEALTVMRSKGINVDAVLEKDENSEKETEEQNTEESDDLPDDTPITAITVGDLRDIIEDALESGDTDDEDETKTAESVVEKDVNEVLALSYVLDCLNYFISYFKDNNVSQDSIDKLTQALALVLDVTKDQAELGKKSINLKAGRTISAKHEELLKGACDHMDKAAEQVKSVLETVATEPDDGEQNDDRKEDDDKSVSQMDSFLQKLANSVKTNNQKTDLTLRLLKTIVSEKTKGGEK